MASERTNIVIPVHSRGTYNTVPYLDKCMETLEKNTNNYVLIFVNDFCDEEGTRAIERHAARHSNSYIVSTQKQRWFTRAANLGLRLVRTPWVVMLNSDTELGEGWLEELYAVRDEAQAQLNGKVGVVGSELSFEEQRRWQNITSPSTPGNPGYCTMHCVLANMQALYEISVDRGMPGWYLDEATQRSIHIFSDNEASYSMQRLWWLTVRSFKALVGHRGGASWGHDLGKACSVQLSEVND